MPTRAMLQRRKLVLFASLLGLAACLPDSPVTKSATAPLQSTQSTRTAPDPVLPDTLFNYARPALPAYLSRTVALAPPPGRRQPPAGLAGRRPPPGGARGPGPGRGGPPRIPSVLSTDSTPFSNRITDAGATLGRVLFYDTSLSNNGQVSCGTCHQQSRGFTDGRARSVGVSGTPTRRNAMSLANARFNPGHRYFWDERARTLEAQVLMPIADPAEIGRPLADLVPTVSSRGYYPALFRAAFGDDRITDQRIARALAQFVGSMVSFGSRYDAGRAGTRSPLEPFANFSALENRGKQLFFRGIPGARLAPCARCHTTDAFIGRQPGRRGGNGPSGASNNGLDGPGAADRGLAEVTRQRRDEGHFRVPSLRNVAVTGPYMHDGRFATLKQVIDHYSDGIRRSPTLSRGLRAPGYRMTGGEKAALVAFLKTLTDPGFLNDPKFADPFPG